MRDSPYRLLHVTDWHVPHHHMGLFSALSKLTRDHRFDEVVAGGDLVDIGGLAWFDPSIHDDDPWGVREEMELVVSLLASLRARKKTIIGGNHEARWAKQVVGKNVRALRGFLNYLSVEAAFRHCGLPDKVRWVEERVGVPGYTVGRGPGKTLIRHGDRQSMKMVAPNAVRALGKDPGMNHVAGHNHRAQLETRSSLGRTWFSALTPGATKMQNYTQGGNPNWQLGSLVIEWPNGLAKQAQPTLIVAQPDGSFAFGGKVYRP